MPKTSANKRHSLIVESHGIFETFLRVLKKLPRAQQNKLLLFAISAMFLAVLEALSVASIALFATAVADPETIFNSTLFQKSLTALSITYSPNHLQVVSLISSGMIVLLLAKNSFRIWQAYHFSKFTGQLENYFGEQILNGYLRLPYEWHLAQNSADLQYTMYARTNIGRSFTEAWLQLGTEFIMIGILLSALLLDRPLISIAILGLSGLAGFAILVVNKPILNRVAKAALQAKMAVNSHSTKIIHGIKDIRLLQKEQQALADYRTFSTPLAKHLALQKVMSLVPGGILETLGFFAMAIFVWLLLADTNASQNVLTSVTLLAVTAWRLLPAISRILNSMNIIRSSLPDVLNVLTFLDTAKTLNSKTSYYTATSSEGLAPVTRITFSDVSFTYENATSPALNAVNFEILANKSLGIIGRSGAGKSTLVDVLVGFFPPSKGTILLDDVPMTAETLPVWRNQLGYVPQTPYICHGTLAENIAFGVSADAIDYDRITECCRMAHIDFWESLPDGVHTFIGERGVKLSGGQLQRIAIARAVYPSPNIIIFDEATSALDAHSEKAILQTIFSLSKVLTVIIIAHNMETVEYCDTVVWLEKGNVRRIGPPKDVVKQYTCQHPATKA